MSGPGSWNDPDMLLIGYAGMTPTEMKTHFALWSFAKAPLILSTDLTKIGNVTDTDSVAYIIQNIHLIKVNQD